MEAMPHSETIFGHRYYISSATIDCSSFFGDGERVAKIHLEQLLQNESSAVA